MKLKQQETDSLLYKAGVQVVFDLIHGVYRKLNENACMKTRSYNKYAIDCTPQIIIEVERYFNNNGIDFKAKGKNDCRVFDGDNNTLKQITPAQYLKKNIGSYFYSPERPRITYDKSRVKDQLQITWDCIKEDENGNKIDVAQSAANGGEKETAPK